MSNTIQPTGAQSPIDTATLAAKGQGTESLGKEDFLKLLVTQLSNQDPLDPTDPTEFVTQLSQFSSLEQLVNIKAGMDLLAVTQTAATSAEVVSFVGREVTFQGDQLVLGTTGEAADVGLKLAGDAEKVTVAVKSAAGDVVRTIEVGKSASGEHVVPFDGKGDDGKALPAGTYSVSVTATDAAGETVEVSMRSQGTVVGVTFEDGYPQLVLADGRKVALGQILEVTTAEQPAPDAAER